MGNAPVVSEEDGVRYLHFGSRWIQGAMRIARPYALELEYTRDMMFPLLMRTGGGWPRTVLSIGLGAGSIARFLLRERALTATTSIGRPQRARSLSRPRSRRSMTAMPTVPSPARPTFSGSAIHVANQG